MTYYKCQEIDDFMKLPRTLPRYAGLARKVLSYYLGELYNPETMRCEIEYNIRFYISGIVELKVFEKEPYDWTVIDNFFRFYLFTEGFKHLKYDNTILDKGYNGVMRGELHQYHA